MTKRNDQVTKEVNSKTSVAELAIPDHMYDILIIDI